MIDVFELAAKLTLNKDDFDKDLNTVGGKVEKFLGSVAKVGAKAVAAATAGIAALTTGAVASYGEYEQLVGGMDTLFKGSSKQMQEYAQNAYMTAQMSANDYMALATDFSAALIASVGGDTAKAAGIADQAISDMADNANKMGSSMESIQSAYRGFSKQNYTMLDNLKLGYGGTKEEMQRLLKDAEKLPTAMGKKFDLSNYADIVEAIHLVQENMGIAGVSQDEAMGTIQGSVAMTKAAWKNLVTALGDSNADLSGYIDNLVTSAKYAVQNIIPVATQAIAGIATAIQSLAPIITESLPGLIETLLPPIISAAFTLVSGLVTALPAIWNSVVAIVPQLFNQLQTAFFSVDWVGIGTYAINMIDTGIKYLENMLPQQMLDIGNKAVEWVNGIDWYDLGMTVLNYIADGISYLYDHIPQILYNIGQSAITLFTNINWRDIGSQVLRLLANGLSMAVAGVTRVFNDVTSIAKGIFDNLKNKALTWGKDMIDNFVQGIKAKIAAVTSAVSNIASTIRSYIHFSEPDRGPLSDFHTYAPDMMLGFADGIRKNASKIEEAFNDSLGFTDKAIDVTASATANKAIVGASPSSGMILSNGVTINVYGTEKQSAADIADEVMERMQMLIDRQTYAFK